MSVLRVNSITNSDSDGAPEFSQGIIIPSGKTVTGNINITGVCTSTSFVGDGTNITVSGGVTNSTIFALTLIT